MAKVNLIIFSPHSNWGGGEQSLACFLNHLRRHYSADYTCRLVLAEPGVLEEHLHQLKIPSQLFPFPYMVGHFRPVQFSGFFHIRRLMRIIREFSASPTIFYFNGFYKCELMIILMRCLFPRIPILVHHRTVLASYPLHCRLALALSTAQLCISDFVKSHLPFPYRHPSRSIRLHNMIDFDRIDQIVSSGTHPPFSNVPCHIAIHSRISPEKGQGDFIRIAHQVSRLADPTRFKFHIYGAPLYGSDDYLMTLRSMIRKEGLDTLVILEGFKAGILDEIVRMDAVLVLSDHEPLGRVVMESMALGRIVMAYGWGGPIELIRHGETGYLIRPRDIEQAAQLIVHLSGNPSEAQRVAMQAFRCSRSMFDHPAYFDRFRTVVQSILG
ncbi:MAG: glycosyltransferase [Candidatus Delongbacteria bacterium]|nr:glycosyltransferase [Candidatus Delongbacteria bacterium]